MQHAKSAPCTPTITEVELQVSRTANHALLVTGAGMKVWVTIQPVLALWAIFARMPHGAQWLALMVLIETRLERRTLASVTHAQLDSTVGVMLVLPESNALKDRTALPGVHYRLNVWLGTTVIGP